MDSDALSTFIAIHRAGGFSKAADLLGRTQPAISRRIALLEGELGVPLFERISGGVVLSQAGKVLLPHAERVAAAVRDAKEAVTALASGNAGPVSLATVGTLASTHLTVVLKQFAAKFPEAELSLQTATSDGVSDLVRRGEVSIGLRYLEDPSTDLTNYALPSEKLVVVCPLEHQFAGRRVKNLSDLRADHWLAFPKDYAHREASAENIFAQFLVRDIASISWAPVDSLTAQKRLIEAGFGIGLLPESSVGEEIGAATLSTILVGDLDARHPVMAIVRREGYLSAASLKLLEMLREEFNFPQ